MAEKRVEYTIGVKNEGLENLTRIIDELDKAGVETGEFKRQAEQLRQQLDEMGRQQTLIDSFVKIKQETVAASAAFDAAQTKAQQLGRELTATDAPTKKQTAEFGRAREAVNSTKDAYHATQLRLQAMRSTLAENNIETTGLAQKQALLRNGVRQVDASVAGATDRLKELGSTGPKAANDTAAATDRAATSTKGYQGALTQVAGAVAGAFAVSKVVDYAKSVQEVADQYKNLEARLRLAVGAQGDLQAAVQGVGDVAKATHTSLDATSVLYARLAMSAKELNITNDEALGITKAINQAIQVSGASAQSSEAAVRQLVQGLQSGVLRGDEFNSVMENSPRLAKALADGLGVPIGALRGLAEAGELTSAKVVRALKGQSEAIDKEFSTLPLTVGRALTNLETQWTLFVGGLTGGAAQSSIAAQGINALAENLDTLASVAARAGAVLTAALAVQGVQALRSFALEMAATGKAANLLTLDISKIPKTVNIAVAATGFEVGWQIGTWARESFESVRKMGVGVAGYAQAVVSSLQLIKEASAAVFTSDTVDAAFDRFKQRNKALKDVVQGMLEDAKTAPSKIAGAADQASGAIGGVGQAAQNTAKLLAYSGATGAQGMGQVASAAQTARSALEGLAKQVNTRPAVDNGIVQIVGDLRAAKLRGDDVEKMLGKDLPDAISKLSGPELAKFRSEFVVAMGIAGLHGKELQTGLRLIGEQAAKSLGVDLVAASNKTSKAFEETHANLSLLIRSMPELKAAGIDTGQVVGEALSKMIDGTKNQAEIDAVIARIKTLRKELGDKVADGLLDQAKQKTDQLKDALDKAKPGINSVAEAMKNLGITSDQSLRDTAKTAKESYDLMVADGTRSARELAEAFRKSAEAAIAANNGIAPSWVQAQAAARGYEVQVDRAGKATLKTAGDGKKAVDDLAQAYKNTGDAAVSALEAQNTAQERLNASVEKAAELERKRLGVDKDGFTTGKDGKRLTVGSNLATLTGIKAFLKSAGVDDDAVSSEIAREFADSRGNVQYMNNQGQRKYGGDTISTALLKAAETYTFGIGGTSDSARKKTAVAPASPPPPASAPTVPTVVPPPAQPVSYISNITIPGVGSASPRFADANSQRDTENLLRQLAQAKGASI